MTDSEYISKQVQQLSINVEVLITKLEAVEGNLKNLECHIVGCSDNHIGLSTRLDRLEQLETSRKTMIGFIWTSIVTMAAALVSAIGGIFYTNH